MNLLISPHNDDETLFAAFTCIREKPLIAVITESYIQPSRGETGCSAETRLNESKEAARILGCPLISLGLRDDTLTEDDVRRVLRKFSGFDKIYAPAIQGGNPQHDMIGRVAKNIFSDCIWYTTYTKNELYTTGITEVIPTEEEVHIKNMALDCYKSQLVLNSTRPHFEAVRGKSEWLI